MRTNRSRQRFSHSTQCTIGRKCRATACAARSALPTSLKCVGANSSQQRTVYDEIGYPIIESVMEGYNGTATATALPERDSLCSTRCCGSGTVFAYGQTGTGKSHTMQGDAEPPEMRGIIPNSFDHVFDAIQNDQTKVALWLPAPLLSCPPLQEFLVRASYLEIYNEEIRDLLGKDSKSKLELKENPEKGVFVKVPLLLPATVLPHGAGAGPKHLRGSQCERDRSRDERRAKEQNSRLHIDESRFFQKVAQC